jgi:hypothetical protein
VKSVSHRENRTGVRTVSSTISRLEKRNSIYLREVDALAERLLQRINQLLQARPDLDPVTFCRHVKRGPSWASEFFNRIRTTNDLRLVVDMARVLRVPVSYLIDADAELHDPKTMTLLGAWRELKHEQHRDAVMNLALTLRGPAPPSPDPPPPETPRGAPRNGPRARGGQTRKSR